MKVVDFHCDTLSELRYAAIKGNHIDFGRNNLHIDLEKLKKGDYMLQCFALFTYLNSETARPLAAALQQIDQFNQLLDKYSDSIAQVKTWADVEKNKAEGKISALLTIEEGACCEDDLAILRVMHSLGVRIMTLTWNFENGLGYPNSVPGNAATVFPCEADTNHGLKDKGIEFIQEMERIGIMVDVSHLSDAGFWDVVKYTKKPFIASHSNARALCGHCRNLTDDMIRAIADRGGLTGLNYCASFLEESENPRSTVELMAKHAAYIKNVGGIDMIGLGSDFDGIGGDLEMYDASCLPLLEAELRKQKFTESEIEKIFFRNGERVLKELLS